ncbi:MAG: hypothetical protein SFZ02_19215 [bacterium]|nr:hypothetical protein [bacterium]
MPTIMKRNRLNPSEEKNPLLHNPNTRIFEHTSGSDGCDKNEGGLFMLGHGQHERYGG